MAVKKGMINKYYAYILIIWIIIYGNTSILMAQQIDGTWLGNYGKSVFTTHPQKVVFNFTVHNDSMVNGSTHLQYKRGNYEHYAITGVYNKKDNSIHFKEGYTLGLKLGFGTSNCKGSYTMKLVRNDSIIRYEGSWNDINRGLFRCPKSTVYFERKKDTFSIPTPKVKDSILSLIEVSEDETDSIYCELYDDAVFDNDVVSIYLNNNVIIKQQTISAEPTIFYINLPKNEPIHKIKMVAISEGAIPPCTAFLKIKTKTATYNINLRSSLITNGVIEVFIK